MTKNRVRKILASVLASGFMVFAMAPSIAALGGVLGTAEEYINLRSTPQWKGSILKVVETGEEFTVLADNGDGWLKVNVNGTIGYLPESYVTTRTVAEPETITTTTAPSTPTSNEGTYTLNKSINVYANAEDARNMSGALKTYSAGTYYIYKSFNGMLNISKAEGVAGGWINPSENGAPSTPNTTTTTSTTTPKATEATSAATNSTVASGSYRLTSSVSVYGTADNALNKVSSIGTYSAGNYFIYKKFNGMYNISKVVGVPGAWINPGTVTNPQPTTTTPISTTPTTTTAVTKAPVVGGEYKISTSVKIYGTADDALNKVSSIGSYSAGNYYIYKSFNGMLNISKTPGVPGAWMNPGTAVVTPTPTTTTPKTTTPITTTPKTTTPPTTTTPVTSAPVVGGAYKVLTSVAIYPTAADASSKSSTIGTYSAGTYYIYKIYDGMYNISKTPGVPGAWINPGTAPGTSVPPITTTPTTTTPAPGNNDVKLPAGYINYSKDLSNYIVERGIRMMSSPGGGSSVAYLEYGTVVKLLTTSGGYSKIEYLGTSKQGWVATTDISKISNESSTVYAKSGGNGYVIGIDPGHGGDDSGAVGYINGVAYTERDMNFKVARKAKEALEKLGFTVVLSQDKESNDDYIYNKMTKFNQAEVDYAISIHHNAGGNQGSLVLYSEDKNNPSADKLNLSASEKLGAFISNELKKVTGVSQNIGDVTFYGDGPLRVNASADAPSALLELGYMDNAKDMSIITSDAGQTKFANAIANGILNMIKSR